MTEITIPPLIYLREAGRTVELCIKPYNECVKSYPLSESQLRIIALDSVNFALKGKVDVKV
jgi:hypothetical protein